MIYVCSLQGETRMRETSQWGGGRVIEDLKSLRGFFKLHMSNIHRVKFSNRISRWYRQERKHHVC